MGRTEKDPETRNFRSISGLVLFCLWVINTIFLFIQVSYWSTIQNILLKLSDKFNFLTYI